MPFDHPSGWVLRLCICLATSAAISLTALFCAWLDYRDIVYLYGDANTTRTWLRILCEEVRKHRDKTGAFPASLADLEVVKKERVRVGDAGSPEDAWGKPFHYQVQGDQFDLYSLGRDGQPGGVGLDADLHCETGYPDTCRLTFRQFLFDADTGGIPKICLLAGILAFPICLLGTRNVSISRHSLTRLLAVHGVTALFAVLAAVVISLLHLPTGH